MIIVDVNGGLGNQMFQFAAGRALSIARGVPLLLDVRSFDSGQMHQGFELARIFACGVALARNSDIRRVLGWQSSRRALRLLGRPSMKFLRKKELLVEPHFQFYPEIRAAPDACYLKGYWQSESYFSSVMECIRQDFTFHLPMTQTNELLAREISGVDAVSLHIRRGDYLSNSKALAVHGICSPQYYERAIAFIADRIPSPVFFIFSDDIDWVRENVRMDYPCSYIDHNRGEESYNDMRLMSLCSHHIIANSSFSWWGAWLNSSDTKIVVAPERWFARETNVTDLLPAGWVRL